LTSVFKMKSSTLLTLTLPVLSNAWTITWRNAEGKESTKSGHGPSKCIQIDHAEGQEFNIDGEGEPNINMLLFTNDKCSGEPSGQATVSFVKEASSDLSGFQVVRLNGDDDDDDDEDDEDSTTTGTGTGSSSGSATPSPTSTSTDDDDDDDDETFTLPTVSATSTSTSSDADETTSPSETASSSGAGAEPTESSGATGTDSDATPSPSESGDDSTPTDGSAQLGLSRTGLAGVVVAAIAGGWALDMLF
jgi:hypothetical protein